MATIVEWKDLSERTCVLTIGDGRSGTSRLDAGAEPMMTDVLDDDDIFTPVRSGSGYVRVVVDDVDDVAGLVGSSPLERPVVLRVDGVTRWQGFLSCESFTQAWDRGPVELELPLVSGLGVIGGLYPSSDLDDLGYISFARFLCDMNAALGGIYGNFYFSAVSEPVRTLRYQFRMANYATATDKNTRHDVATYGEILEDVCRLFGWCAVEVADGLVFLTADLAEVDMVRFTASGLAEYAAGTGSDCTTLPYGSVSAEIWGAGHSRSFLGGKKRVEVSGDLNEQDDVIWEMDVEEQCVYKGNGRCSYYPVVYETEMWGAYQGEGSSSVNGNIRAWRMGTIDKAGHNIKFEKFKDDTFAYGGSVVIERFYKENTSHELTAGSKDYVARIIVKGLTTGLQQACEIHTNYFYDLSQNVRSIRIEGEVTKATNAGDVFETVDGTLYCRMALIVIHDGVDYYHHISERGASAWSTEPDDFIVAIRKGEIEGFGYTDGSGAEFRRSIGAPPMSGEIVLILMATTNTDYGPGEGYLSYEGLSIILENSVSRMHPAIARKERRESQNSVVKKIENGFNDTWSSECGLTLAREAVPDSLGVVLDENRGLPASLYGGTWPEDALAERARRYFSKGREKLQVVVKSEGAMLDPMKGYELVSGGRVYVCVGQSVNWKTNEVVGCFFEQTEED